MNNVIDLLLYKDRALKQVMDAIAEELTIFDEYWHCLTLEVSVNQYTRQMLFIPLYQSINSDEATLLYLNDQTDMMLTTYCFNRYKKDDQQWNKLKLVIKRKAQGYGFVLTQKYDEDLKQLHHPGQFNPYQYLELETQLKILEYEGIAPNERQHLLADVVE